MLKVQLYQLSLAELTDDSAQTGITEAQINALRSLMLSLSSADQALAPAAGAGAGAGASALAMHAAVSKTVRAEAAAVFSSGFSAFFSSPLTQMEYALELLTRSAGGSAAPLSATERELLSVLLAQLSTPTSVNAFLDLLEADPLSTQV